MAPEIRRDQMYLSTYDAKNIDFSFNHLSAHRQYRQAILGNKSYCLSSLRICSAAPQKTPGQC